MRYRFESKDGVLKEYNKTLDNLITHETLVEKIITIRQIKDLYREFIKRITLASQTKLDATLSKISANYGRIHNLKTELKEQYRGNLLVTIKRDEVRRRLARISEEVNKLFSKKDFEETLPLVEEVIRTRKRMV